MFDEDQLRRLSAQQRRELMCTLAAIDEPRVSPGAGGERRRRVMLAVVIVCCIALAAWTGLLAATLPRYYRTGGWRGAWVGFDLALLGAFLTTGWASWRRRQVLIICLIVLATLLCCDAWFDVVLDARTPGFYWSLLSALLIELPLAGVAILGARRLLRMTSVVLARYQGQPAQLPRLRDIGLVGITAGRPLHDLLASPESEEAEAVASGGSRPG